EGGLAEAYLGLLRPQVEAALRERAAARASAAAAGRDAVTLANASFERQRTAQMEGRAAELDQVAAYLLGKHGAGTPLVVTGAAGSGKSTLLAEAVKRAAALQPRATMLVRYIGVTPGASSLAELLAGLRRTIAQAYGEAEPE